MIDELLGGALLCVGVVLALLGTLGACRFHDLYARVKAMSLVNGLAAVCIHLSSLGLVPPGHGLRGGLTALLFLLSGPALAHALALTAYRADGARGLPRDELGRDEAGRRDEER